MGKEYVKAVYCHCLFNLHAEYIMWNARLDESQAGIKIAGRENKPRHADDITLTAENEEELNSLLIRVKEESEKGVLKQHSKNIWLASGPITSWQIDGEKVETVADFIFLSSKITVDGGLAATKLKDTCSLEEKQWQP